MTKFWFLLGMLAQLASCASQVLSIPNWHALEPREISATTPDLLDAAAMTSDHFVIVSGGINEWEERTITILDPTESTTAATIPKEKTWCRGERLIGSVDGAWWYSRCGGDVKRLYVRSVTAGGGRSLLLDHDPAGAATWLALGGAEHEGVLLLLSKEDEQHLRAELVSNSVRKDLGDFYRRGFLGFGRDTWQGQRLDEHRIAIVSIEGGDRDDSEAIMLRVFGDAGALSEARLPFDAASSWSAIETASSGNGDLAVVGVTVDGRVTGMAIDPEQPWAATSRVLAPNDAVDLPIPVFRVEWTGSRFAAVWLQRSDHTLRLREFDRRFCFPEVVVGERAADTFLAVHRAAEGIDVFWTGAGGLKWRRLPGVPTGYLLGVQMWDRARKLLDEFSRGIAPDRP